MSHSDTDHARNKPGAGAEPNADPAGSPRDKLVIAPEARARELFDSGYCCSESVLMAIAEHRGIRSELIPAIASGFCGGIGRTGGVCGAVSGAIIGLGLVSGRNSARASNEELFKLVKLFMDSFKKRFGAADCPGLLDCDIGTWYGKLVFKKNNLIAQCRDFTGTATALAVYLLDARDDR